MLSSFKKHPRRNKLELKLRKTKIRFHSWWNKFHYGGGPNDDPTILTKRPRHIPFISLRNDEYGEFLKINENTSQKNISKAWLPSDPAYVTIFDHNRAINQVLQNQYYISRRFKQRKPKSKELGFSIYQDNFKNKQNAGNILKLSIINTPGNVDEATSLSSFEQDLMISALENNRDKLFPFGKPAKSRGDNNWSNENERHDDDDKSFNTSDTSRYQMDNVMNDNYIKKAHDEENKENNTDSLSKLFNKVDKTINESNNNFHDDKNGFRNWANNKLLTGKIFESEIDQIKHADKSQNFNKSARVPMIQRPEFFERQLKSKDSNYSILVELSVEELERFQEQNYFGANKLNKKQRKRPDINNEPIGMKLEVLKGNTMERISSLISSLPSLRSTWAGKSVSEYIANKNIKKLYPDFHRSVIDDLSLSAAKKATSEIYGPSMNRNNYNNSNGDLASFSSFEDPIFFDDIKMGKEILTVKQLNKLIGKTYAESKMTQIKKNKKKIARTASGRKILDNNYPLMPNHRPTVNLLAEIQNNYGNEIEYAEKAIESEFDIIASYQQLSG